MTHPAHCPLIQDGVCQLARLGYWKCLTAPPVCHAATPKQLDSALEHKHKDQS